MSEKHKHRLLLIGGYPKSYEVPFDVRTLSGKRLWNIILKNNLKDSVRVMDLWENRKDELNGKIHEHTLWYINFMHNDGFRVIALGKWVHGCLKKTNLGIDVEYLPHPASRRKIDLVKLEQGLMKT